MRNFFTVLVIGVFLFSGSNAVGLNELNNIQIEKEYQDILSFNGPEEVWNKTFGTAEYDESGNSIQFTKDGGYIIAGTSTDDVLLIKTDADGNEIWYKTYSSDADYNGHSVKQTNDGGFVVTGTKFENSEYDVLLIKTDSEGNIE